MDEPRFLPIPPSWSTADLADAAMLDLGVVSVQLGARAVIEQLTTMVAAHDGLKRRRSDLVILHRAVGAVVGGVLRSWRKGRAVFRPRETTAFTGELVGFRPFCKASEGLVRLGFLATKGASGYAVDFGDGLPGSVRWAARFRPTARLLALAACHGITPDNVREQFGLEFSTIAPKVPVELVQRRALKASYGKPRTIIRRGTIEPPDPDDVTFQRLTQEVRDANDFITGFTVDRCTLPRWRRPFGPSWLLGGRWTALGSSGVYQGMSKLERAAITIGGSPTVEVDISASHLSIMHGLLGLPLPEGDLYAIPGVPREVAKQWVTATLGKGSPVAQRWPAKAAARQPDLRAYPASEVGAAVITRYPFMAAPAKGVAVAAGLLDMADLGLPGRLLPHRLMGIEAAAMSEAMASLRGRGVPALPVHDSLIVLAGDVSSAVEALQGAFEALAGVRVRVTLPP